MPWPGGAGRTPPKPDIRTPGAPMPGAPTPGDLAQLFQSGGAGPPCGLGMRRRLRAKI